MCEMDNKHSHPIAARQIFENLLWSEERAECMQVRNVHNTVDSQKKIGAHLPGRQCHHLERSREASEPQTNSTEINAVSPHFFGVEETVFPKTLFHQLALRNKVIDWKYPRE